jgi:hypothetical protein
MTCEVSWAYRMKLNVTGVQLSGDYIDCLMKGTSFSIKLCLSEGA